MAESCANVAVGYGVALAAQIVIFPLLGIAVSLSQNLIIGGAFFTIVSIVRSYMMRRLFNAIHVRFQ